MSSEPLLESVDEPPRLPSAGEISRGLKSIRGRRMLLWSAFVAFVPALALFAFSGPFALLLFSATALVATGAQLWVLQARCPRCRELFHKRKLGYNVFTRECLHCSLPLNWRGK